MRCYLCGRGLTARTRARLSPSSRLVLAVFALAAPCDRLSCLRRTARTLHSRAAYGHNVLLPLVRTYAGWDGREYEEADAVG